MTFKYLWHLLNDAVKLGYRFGGMSLKCHLHKNNQILPNGFPIDDGYILFDDLIFF